MSARPGLGRLGLHQRRRDAVGLAGRACFHVLSVVEWLTRWTVENSSCKPVTCSVGGGLFCCLFLFPLCQVGGPDRFFQSGGQLEKFNAHAVHLTSCPKPGRLCYQLDTLRCRSLRLHCSTATCHLSSALRCFRRSAQKTRCGAVKIARCGVG